MPPSLPDGKPIPIPAFLEVDFATNQ